MASSLVTEIAAARARYVSCAGTRVGGSGLYLLMLFA
jgi:hypothetical protein